MPKARKSDSAKPSRGQSGASAGKVTVIGLVGGIASGKSHVAGLLVELGAELIDADTLAHTILKRPLVVRRLTQIFGDGILSLEGVVNRNALAKLVFGEGPQAAENLKQLEAVVHPLIHAEAVARLRTLKECSSPPPAVVVDAPLLLEANWHPLCDLILFVDAPRDVRLSRAIERGWTEAQFAQREATQWSLDEKRRAATHMVDSGASDSHADRLKLKRQLRDIWEQIS